MLARTVVNLETERIKLVQSFRFMMMMMMMMMMTIINLKNTFKR